MEDTIFFLTTNNLATNPRLTKELWLCLNSGYNATVFQFVLGNWSDEITRVLKKELIETFGQSIQFVELNATSENRLEWFTYGLLEKLSRKIYPHFRSDLCLNAFGHSRRSFQLLKTVRNSKTKPDLVIGHNLASLYPSYILSDRYNCPFIFDIEDYHPGEYIVTDSLNEKRRRQYLLKTILPNTDAITSASPLIGLEILKLIGGHKNHKVVLNGFPEKEFNKPDLNSKSEKLKLVWFSQKISFNRGLEQLIAGIKKMPIEKKRLIHLTLIGQMDTKFYSSILKTLKDGQLCDLEILNPLEQSVLHRNLVKYDVGLAIEPGKDYNNKIALSNKILAYAQGGVYILATDTPAQKDFITKFPKLGRLSGSDSGSLTINLSELIDMRHELRKKADERMNMAQTLSWDEESKKIKTLWKTILN